MRHWNNKNNNHSFFFTVPLQSIAIVRCYQLIVNLPYSEDSEGPILHSQGQVNTIRAYSRTADGLLHIAARDQSVIYKAPYPSGIRQINLRKKAAETSHTDNETKQRNLWWCPVVIDLVNGYVYVASFTGAKVRDQRKCSNSKGERNHQPSLGQCSQVRSIISGLIFSLTWLNDRRCQSSQEAWWGGPLEPRARPHSDPAWWGRACCGHGPPPQRSRCPACPPGCDLPASTRCAQINL